MDQLPLAQLWTGRILSGIAVLFFLMDAMGKLLRVDPVMEATTSLGYPAESVFTLGVLLLIGVVLYSIPQTTVIGAIYLTGFLGGALAAHFRIGSPLFTHQLFSIYLAAFMWGGLVLRKPQLLSLMLGR